MTELLSQYYTPIKILVALTFIAAFIVLDKNKQVNKYIRVILLTCFLTELLVPLALYYKLNSKLIQSVGIVCHQSLWIMLVLKAVRKNTNVTKFIIPGFLISGMVNLILGEGINKFNYMSFVIGAFIYLTIFMLKNIKDLKNENVNAFLENDYLLLFSPVIFFFGMSFMLAFRGDIIDIKLFDDVTLWVFVVTYINVIYYVLINLYIFREYRRTRIV
ncbi:hypothetical protein [Flavobacterium sp. 3HN19-14]|uniref:hypothetical protein n=1 Tax=Flavobacterium sp. 3HN19-14 TaxID=3448133 RepID=UPI003EDEEF0B